MERTVKCKGCGNSLNVKYLIENGFIIEPEKPRNPSFKWKCPFCGAPNNIKCRHIKYHLTKDGRVMRKGGTVKKIKIRL